MPKNNVPKKADLLEIYRTISSALAINMLTLSKLNAGCQNRGSIAVTSQYRDVLTSIEICRSQLEDLDYDIRQLEDDEEETSDE